MHLHILGICGTFMGGVAVLAREAGHRVSGSDQNVYPPMSTQLESLGIPLHEGFDAAVLTPAPDAVVVGNVMSRGSEVVEHLLDAGLPYTSGPQWLAEHVLRGRHVLAVAGTHGKTGTASMLAWILEHAGLEPGFLIGGVPVDFGVSARLGNSEYFVVEADEYDTAFFDKRSKFVHYRPRTLALTNLEYDHADIFPDIAAIRRQFHHLVRTVPGSGLIIAHDESAELRKVLDMGCWSPVATYGSAASEWQVSGAAGSIEVTRNDASGSHAARAAFAWPGTHNLHNALAACVAASHVGVSPEQSLAALACWRGVRRRLELAGTAGGVTVYDDFAHHPTEIAATLQALRSSCDAGQRVIALFEPRSNSMKQGVHAAALGDSFAAADKSFVFQPPGVGWDIAAALADAGVEVVADDALFLQRVISALQPGDQVAVMSNGAFGGMPRRLLQALQDR
ncbi:MAG: UDP-N-acetylmuramate:L-alanyl-gamma-D-glutamyl-meso-diaminopimelate ligase [Gammaproteobacteria bacterium]|nr:UDP-N-acetylmuramate:L-alanyl-gamma-D-glutamyl-meso-diaminopimelate ligase [Gammaproteobacteria bacterium]NNF62594.1 UDP-N-acetylmuramate:L-alanyl-gamma-D-glutamyl-meso-diaminopimelate ligase [Gammaproteobacteria bacterium]NNM20171.1 UDP-N-acetylmuramate:L-alanyl-gamma-D-glutamyl-meso-diaminopimelate ligase [Gammaproteobacteria bacterium]